MDAEIHESMPMRDTVESLFQPDTIASAEYFDGRRASAAEPERELVLALIEDAVFCFKKYRDSKQEKEQRLFADAEEWFFSDDREWPLSFLNVCDLLGLDPGYLRSGLLRWKNAKPGTRPKQALTHRTKQIKIKTRGGKRNGRETKRNSGSAAQNLRRCGSLR